MLLNITVTQAAEKFMRRIVRFSGLPDGAGFRLVVSAGGCSGYAAEFTAEPALQAGEQELDVNGLKVFLPTESRLMLDGVTIDFTDTPMQSGLTFVNPKQGVCGCSSSSDAKPAGIATIDIGNIARTRPVLPPQAS